jgi:disulfide bond formation protein DsbB
MQDPLTSALQNMFFWLVALTIVTGYTAVAVTILLFKCCRCQNSTPVVSNSATTVVNPQGTPPKAARKRRLFVVVWWLMFWAWLHTLRTPKNTAQQTGTPTPNTTTNNGTPPKGWVLGPIMLIWGWPFVRIITWPPVRRATKTPAGQQGATPTPTSQPANNGQPKAWIWGPITLIWGWPPVRIAWPPVRRSKKAASTTSTAAIPTYPPAHLGVYNSNRRNDVGGCLLGCLLMVPLILFALLALMLAALGLLAQRIGRWGCLFILLVLLLGSGIGIGIALHHNNPSQTSHHGRIYTGTDGGCQGSDCNVPPYAQPPYVIPSNTCQAGTDSPYSLTVELPDGTLVHITSVVTNTKAGAQVWKVSDRLVQSMLIQDPNDLGQSDVREAGLSDPTGRSFTWNGFGQIWVKAPVNGCQDAVLIIQEPGVAINLGNDQVAAGLLGLQDLRAWKSWSDILHFTRVQVMGTKATLVATSATTVVH